MPSEFLEMETWMPGSNTKRRNARWTRSRCVASSALSSFSKRAPARRRIMRRVARTGS